MAGIISFAAHVPAHRLARSVIAQYWEAGGPPGERAVAGYDEDSITMAVAAARNCLRADSARKIDALYFATTTPPYLEKQNAALVAAALGLADLQTMDFGNSLRCGTSAISAALNAINSGAAETVLVCAADMRQFRPRSMQEMNCGDGAAAILLGKQDLVAEIEWFDSVTDEMQDAWRIEGERFIRSAEERFVQDLGYGRVVRGIAARTFKKRELKAEQFTKVCGNFTDSRAMGRAFAGVGFKPEQVQNCLEQSVGDTGAAMALMNAVVSLESAAAGDRILVSSYGNGCDLFSIRTTDAIAGYKPGRAVGRQVEQKIMLNNYGKYLIWRRLVDVQMIPRPPLEERQPTPPAQWRETKAELTLTGTRCRSCGTAQYPPQRVCMICKAKDQNDAYGFSWRTGKVFSFSHDYIMETLDSPATTTVIDFEGGGRMICDMTDRRLDEIQVGIDVEMTFRKLYTVGGIHNYWWKCTPVREGR